MPTIPRESHSVVKIQTWHMERFAEFLKKMAATKDGDGSLLDHSIFLYGSNMGNSDKHSNWPIPTVIVGGGNGKMKLGGQHIDLAQRTPLANVLLTLLHKFGIEQRQDCRQHRHDFRAVGAAAIATETVLKRRRLGEGRSRCGRPRCSRCSAGGAAAALAG